MFKVTGGGASYSDLDPRQAVAKAQALREGGINDVEVFGPRGERLSLYALDQLIRANAETAH